MSLQPSPTRVTIMAAAAAAFARYGYHGVSMRDLARTADRSPAAFYNHFTSKEELLYCLQRDAFADLLDGARAAQTGDTDAADRLFRFILGHVRYLAARPDIMRVLVQEAGALTEPRRASIRRQKEAYFAVARDLIADILVERNAGALEDDEIERTTYSIFGMLNWTYGWYRPRRHGRPETVARTIHRLALAGLSGAREEDPT